MAIELVHLCDAHFTLRDPVSVPDTPLGTRMIFEVASGTAEGERIKATLRPGAASGDWLTVDGRGIGTLDVRATLETHDGAMIFVTYRGRVNVATAGAIYTAPLFDTGDERYLWLNSIQAVGKGQVEGNQLTYEIYELR